MGTKVQNLPGYYSMRRDLNEESSSCGWPLFHSDRTPTNGMHYDNHLPNATSDACSVQHDKDVVKRMMLEHEAIFKNQVCELHRLYRTQRDLMNDFKRKELHNNQTLVVEASICTGPLTSQLTTGDGRKRHVSGFPVGNSTYAKPSVSGAAGVYSPLGSIQGISNRADPFPSPDRGSLKDVGVLDSSRPSKVRRKMFDLSLPADEYVDTDESDEKLGNEKTSGSTLFLPDRSSKNGKGNDHGKACCQDEDISRSDKSLKRRNGFTDLNEPVVQVDETYDSPFLHVPSNSVAAIESSDVTARAKQNFPFFGLSSECSLNSRHGTDSWVRNNGYLENNGNGKGVIPSVADAGYAKRNLQSVPQDLKPEKSLLSLQTMQHTYSKAREPASENKYPESVLPLHRHGLIAAARSSDLSKSWSHSAASWGMASCSLSQKLISGQTPPYLNASGAINKSLEDFWPLNMNSKPNSSIQCDAPLHNGFYQGSSSGSKEPSMYMSSISYDYLNHNNDSKLIPEHFINKGSNFNDKKMGKDINLNVILSNGSYNNNLVSQSSDEIMDGDVLSWLRAKNTFKVKGETDKVMHGVTSVSGSNTVDQRRNEVRESSSNKKILGVPIFDLPRVSPMKELSSITSPSASIRTAFDAEAVENKHKNWMFDMNIPCDDNDLEFDKEGFTETVVSKTPTAEADVRNQIDLNLSMSEDEGSFTTIPTVSTNMNTMIDLEAPAVLESEEDIIQEETKLETSLALPQVPQDVEQPQYELVRNAAEAIVVLSSLSCDQVDVAINSPSENSMVDPLSWFVDVVCKENLDSKCHDSREKDGEDGEAFDYFESMTLKLEETKEEDYMPKPLVPENFKLEETTSALPTQTRRGPARRGRQKRDFQKDILPGLVSLSRHEVTEDIQTFGGFMQSTGHSWKSGLTRRSSTRNGSGRRGRPRAQVTPYPSPPVATNETNTALMQQVNSIEMVLEDKSLTGWGRTTRRPRRQRCPASNRPLIPIT